MLAVQADPERGTVVQLRCAAVDANQACRQLAPFGFVADVLTLAEQA